MSDISIRIEGRAGRITLTRPQALNALTYEMCMAIDAALIAWADDPAVALVLIDAEGPRAFCAGGDIAELHARGTRGDYGYGRTFWRDEYRMNARLAEFPKPVVSFLHGFIMGGGVGVGCHAGLRILGESARIAMPECGIGLVPDVGGTLLLARAPGRMGAYLGLTGARMGPADAIRAGFADTYAPEAEWDALKARMIETGDASAPERTAPEVPEIAAALPAIDTLFGGHDLAAIFARLEADPGAFAQDTLKTLRRNSPLAMAATLEILHRLGPAPDIRAALTQEYRYTWRAMEQSDFLEGIRAAIIDKDRKPRWRHDGVAAVSAAEVDRILAPLGADDLSF